MSELRDEIHKQQRPAGFVRAGTIQEAPIPRRQAGLEDPEDT
jgi:hypothetical protein